MTISSPNKRIQVRFVLDHGTPTYAVTFEDKPVIEPSSIGLTLKEGSLAGPFQVLGIQTSQDSGSWTPVWGTASEVSFGYQELEVTLEETNPPGRRMVLVFRASDDGAAFRYVLPEQPGMPEFNLTAENTQFTLPGNQKCFALQRSSFGDSYEGTYDPVQVDAIPGDAIVGLPLLVEGDGFWFALTEAALVNHAGLSVQRDGSVPNRLVSRLSPLPNEPDVVVRAKTPHASPWRTILIGERAGDMIESNLIPTLNEPSKISDTSWIRPALVMWPWWNNRVSNDPKIKGGGPSTAVLNYYIDFAAENGIKDLVIDAGWYSLEMDAWNQPEKEDVLTMEETRAAFYNVRDVIDHGKEKGVSVYLWVHLASLRGRVEEVLSTYADWGAAGIKLDNFGGDSQSMVNDLHHVIEVAAQHEMIVDYHGAYRPTGEGRTWPNFMSCEAVMGLEYSKGNPKPTPQHNVTLPFTRMLAGPMDYTPGAFDLDGAEGYQKYVQTTRAQQIAMYVVFFSPLQMLIDYPAAYISAPAQWEFVKKIPTTWDQTLFLDGYPGDFVALARRQGSSWWAGFMTDENPRDIEVTLDFLADGTEYTAHIVRDGDNAAEDHQSTATETRAVKKGDRWVAKLAGSGGQAVRFDPN